ncbi:exostosin-like glycosyltransferase [Haematococcus lacustris]
MAEKHHRLANLTSPLISATAGKRHQHWKPAMASWLAMCLMLLTAPSATASSDGGASLGRTMLPHQELDYPYGKEAMMVASDQQSEDLQRSLLEYNHRRQLAQTTAAGRPAGRQRCRVTRSTWCGQYHKQPPLAWAPAPRGSKLCPNNCSFTGNCNHDTGQCDCPAGWEGLDCSTRRSRPCTNRFRSAGDEPAGHIDVNGRDLDWTVPGWKSTRCPGICDDTYAACYCDGKYGFIPPPPPSAQHPYGSPPVKYGRVLGDHCHPSTTYDGRRVSWGHTSYEKVYGASGWCNATIAPEDSCGCYQDGYYGNECEKRYEQTCMNQCSGHGECVVGFCKCHDGWYGTDCARKIAGAPMEPSLHESQPWLRQHVGLPLEAQPQLPSTPRKRPLIYIYDLPPAYNARMLQYRVYGPTCVWRMYGADNHTVTQDNNVYGVEPYFWEALSQSQYRTFDPEQADFFYVPLFISCWLLPVWSIADYPWWHGPSPNRVHQASNLMLEVQQWLQKTHPWWDRRGGRDHVWLTPHDEGACWAPRVITDNSIILTHWGRMDANHTSNTAYGADNYSEPIRNAWQKTDWRLNWQGGRCYHPDKDLVIPSWKPPHHFKASPLMGALPLERDVLFYFKGDVGKSRLQWYSRGIRQKLYKLSIKEQWREKYTIMIGDRNDLPPGYSEWLARSKYCLVAPGDGWSGRMEDAILHGCVPVIIMDQVHAVFETILDVDQFAVHITEAQMAQLPTILLSIPDDKWQRMQRRITHIWHRYAYATGPLQGSGIVKVWKQGSQAARENRLASVDERQLKDRPAFTPPTLAKAGPRPVTQWPFEDDAFHTIMQWLYSRIPHTRSKPDSQQTG